MGSGTNDKNVYIVISQTGTILSRILKIITRREYNHASISLEEDLSVMYSFGRKYPYNPFFGGFVKESANFGTFKRFSDTKVLVLRLNIGEGEYNTLSSRIRTMLLNPQEYKYNYLGLYLAALKISFKSENRYYCSEFVKDLLVSSNISGAHSLANIVHPMSFTELPHMTQVYCGRLKDYKSQELAVF